MLPRCHVCECLDPDGIFTYTERRAHMEGDEESWVFFTIWGWCQECFEEYSTMINGTNPNPAIEAWEIPY